MSAFELVFCDVDGTLENSRHVISDDTKKAVRALTQKGVPFVLATGRTPTSVVRLLELLEIKAPFIASNGGYVGAADGTSLSETGFDLPTAQKIRLAARAFLPEVECTAYCGDKWVVENPDTPAVLAEREVVGVAPVVGLPEDFVRTNGFVQKVMCIDPKDKMSALAAHLKKVFPDFDIFVSNENMLEILPAGVSKAWGAAEICRLMKIPAHKTLAFGDGVNDLGLFAFSGLAIAMGNAPDVVRQKAAHVTTSNDGNGIARTLNSLFDL